MGDFFTKATISKNNKQTNKETKLRKKETEHKQNLVDPFLQTISYLFSSCSCFSSSLQ